MIAVQIFDQRKFKKRDQGFLGVVNVKVSDVIDLELGGHGTCLYISLRSSSAYRRIGVGATLVIKPLGRGDACPRSFHVHFSETTKSLPALPHHIISDNVSPGD